MDSGWNLSETSENSIFHCFEHRNPSFNLGAKAYKKSYLERVRFPALAGHGPKIPAVLLGDA
jgi:hypothetical protein